MKKLLLILICLFVSFEVKSESDDLKGLILECEKKFYSGPDVYIEFLSNNEIKTIQFDKKKLKVYLSQYVNYSMETFEVKFNFKGFSYKLDRNSGWLTNLKYPTNPDYICKKLNKEITNLDSYLNEKMTQYKENRKSYRKF